MTASSAQYQEMVGPYDVVTVFVKLSVNCSISEGLYVVLAVSIIKLSKVAPSLVAVTAVS